MSKLETRLIDFARHLWAMLTIRTFALWEVLLVILLVGKKAPWWIAAPGFGLWMLLRGLGNEK